ncbi:unnamed protein product, partial [Iphiclides podalirius]
MSKAAVIPGCSKDIGGIKEEISLSPPDKKDGAIGLFSRLLRLDTLSKRNSTPESLTVTEANTTYYGVYIPCEIKKGPDEEALHVYKNKSEALELVRRYKSARFKMFRNHQDAVSFALRGAEPTDVPDGNSNSLMGEKPYPFKAPSPQDMVSLRKAIESGLACTVRDRIWDNPRYLVSSGNTPAIMQEGSRYNALHIAAKAMNAEICNLILTTVGNPSFVQTLYGMDADPESCKEFSSILVDRYLNTPDKAMNETPLHFAAKFGADAVVDVLTAFPQCNTLAANKYGEQPKDIICNRASSAPPDVARRILGMLQERFYVPVLHSEDGSAEPTIGRPFTPAAPPEINSDPLSPRFEIRAFAGPMASRDADVFRRRWKTPPRASFRLAEMTKGLETVGRNLAEQMKVGWKEYWPFLDTFTDLRTSEGLTLLENYLKAKYECACSFAYSDSRAQSRRSPDLSLSRISVGSVSPDTARNSLSPMSELCAAMDTCRISDRPVYWQRTDPVRQRLCRQPGPSPANGRTASRLLCIERTCQVFAKRVADALVFSLTAGPNPNGLKSEARHLQHTISTYMEDERFASVDFGRTHARLAQLVAAQLGRGGQPELVDVLRSWSEDVGGDEERRGGGAGAVEGHARCLAGFVARQLTEPGAEGPAGSEAECSSIWARAERCRCRFEPPPLERAAKRASFRRNRSTLSSSPKGDSFIRRLMFLDDQDIGDGKVQHNEPECPISMNSPAGDSSALYTVDVAKCRVVEAEISDDDSGASCHSDSEEAYHTASENGDGDQLEDASDRALVEPFIYGEEPTKMDRLVYEAIIQCDVPLEKFPNVYRWRHTVALYPPKEMERWPAVDLGESVSNACVSLTGSPSRLGGVSAPGSPYSGVGVGSPCIVGDALGSPCGVGVGVGLGNAPGSNASPASGRGLRSRAAARCSTPKRECEDNTGRTLPLQVSNWLRVTGPNSPRSATATRNMGQNVSFGF